MPRPATRLARLSSLLLLLLLLLAPVATRCDDDDNVAAAETGATRDAAAGDHLGDVPVALDAEKTKIDVDAPTLKDANAELENIMASELGKAMRGKSMEERVGILGKLQSPEGHALVKEHFNSEKFQDALDKKEAERGITRPGNPYNELARQRKAEKEGKNWEYYYGDYEPEIYAGNFRLEIRYGKNEEYEMLTEQVVAESTDGKYYFVMPEAACKKKVQVRVTGLGPDGDETEAVESKAKKIKC